MGAILGLLLCYARQMHIPRTLRRGVTRLEVLQRYSDDRSIVSDSYFEHRKSWHGVEVNRFSYTDLMGNLTWTGHTLIKNRFPITFDIPLQKTPLIGYICCQHATDPAVNSRTLNSSKFYKTKYLDGCFKVDLTKEQLLMLRLDPDCLLPAILGSYYEYIELAMVTPVKLYSTSAHFGVTCQPFNFSQALKEFKIYDTMEE